MVGFGEKNEEFGKVPPSLITCEETKDEEGFAENSILIKFITDTGTHYEIRFPSYIMHLTRNESYTAWDDYEIREGRYLVIFSRSRLMDFYGDEIVHTKDYSWPGRGKHYGIYTADHIIDIIADCEPAIIRL